MLSPAFTAGRTSMILLMSLLNNASTAAATARKVFPVPAGPYANEMVLLRIFDIYSIWTFILQKYLTICQLNGFCVCISMCLIATAVAHDNCMNRIQIKRGLCLGMLIQLPEYFACQAYCVGLTAYAELIFTLFDIDNQLFLKCRDVFITDATE